MNGWGGKREGAGRKPQLESKARKNCTLKANAEEWKIILDFAKILKHGDRQAAIDFVNQYQS